VYFHDNGIDMGRVLHSMLDLASLTECNVLIFEYPEYGFYKRNGRCRSKDIYADIDFIFKYLKSMLGINSDSIILYGKGMGCHFALYAAIELELPFYGIILQNVAIISKDIGIKNK
jgi:hypothetical protein